MQILSVVHPAVHLLKVGHTAVGLLSVDSGTDSAVLYASLLHGDSDTLYKQMLIFHGGKSAVCQAEACA